MAGEQVLVVEDNEKNMKLFRDVLQASGYRLLEATTGEQAVDLATTHTPDLVLMDIQLPDIDGLQLTREFKADPDLRDIPVVAVTSYAMKGDRQKSVDAGCDGYITKPIDTRQFPLEIEKYLRGTGTGSSG